MVDPSGPTDRVPSDTACRRKASALPLLSVDSEPCGPGPQGEACAHVFCARAREVFFS